MNVAEQFTGMAGVNSPLEQTVKDFRSILNGEVDDLPEQAFYMVGTLDDARAKAAEMAGARA